MGAFAQRSLRNPVQLVLIDPPFGMAELLMNSAMLTAVRPKLPAHGCAQPRVKATNMADLRLKYATTKLSAYCSDHDRLTDAVPTGNVVACTVLKGNQRVMNS